MRVASIWIILALVLSLSLFGCAKDAGNTPDSPTQSTKVEPSPTPIGYGFTYDGVTFGIGMDAEKAIEALGAPKSEDKTESCAFGGFDIVYTYDNFKISANDEHGFQRIYCVTLINDMAETAKGICCGSTSDDVIAAYGEPTSSNAAGMYYEKDGMELQFLMKDGAVDKIQYYDASAL